MSRLDIKTPSRAQTVVEGLYRDVERRIAASPPGLCPVEMSLSFLQLCHAQTCGKCVPCRIGLGQLAKLISQVLDGTANMDTVRIIEKTARSIVDTADCAIGRDAARLVVDGLEGFRDDYEEHVQHHRCLASLQNPVPCVALCPAGVDIPGYMALVGVGRYADAVRLIRKDNPMPTACAYICEHPCEARCRRNMIDDPINIRGLKRYAVDHAGVVPNPPCAPATGKTVAIVGGGPSGLSCAYYLALMGHKVTIFEECSKLGGMLRYGIPSYRLPREKLDAEIDSILSLGIEVRTNVRIGRDIWLEELEKQFDCIYIAIGAHQDKKTGIPGEDSRNVMSAVEMLKAIGDDVMPDFTGKQVVVIGGGNVAMDVTRSSIRLGAGKVTCVYRRRLEDMTALPDEVAGATAEGAEMMTLAAPVRIEADEDGVARALWVQPQIIGDVDSSGRPKPNKAALDQVRIPADIIVVAIGQGIEIQGFDQAGVPITRGGRLVAALSGQVNDMDNIFAGGDVVTGPKFAIDAIAAGREGAISLHRYVHEGQSLTLARDPREFYELDKKAAVVPIDCFDAPARKTVAHDASKAKTFSNDRITFTEAQVKAEASRCLGCGVSVVDQNKCIGCGLCTTRCEFDAIHLTRDVPEASRMTRTEDKMKAILPQMVKRAAKLTIKDIKGKRAK